MSVEGVLYAGINHFLEGVEYPIRGGMLHPAASTRKSPLGDSLIGDAAPGEDAPDVELLAKPSFGPDIPVALRMRIEAFARKRAVSLSVWMQHSSFAILWLLAHQGINVQTRAPGSSLSRCAVHSWTTIAASLTILCVKLAQVVWEGSAPYRLPLTVTLANDIANIFFGIFISSTAGTFDFDASAPLLEVCAGSRNPISGFAIFFGDISGLINLIKSCLTLFARPISLGRRRLTGWASVLAWLVLAVSVQLTVLDLWLVPLLSTAVRKNEENGDTLQWISDVLGVNTTATE